jgi:cytochrome c biogenesis protein CcdA
MHPWRRIALLTVLLTGAAIHPLQAADGLSIIPGRWEFGTIPDTEAIHLEVTVRNQGEESVRITFIPTCDCLFVEPGQAQLSSRSEEVFVLTFDPASYDGAIDMDYIVRTTVPGLERALFRVSGQVQPAAGAAAGPGGAGAPGGEQPAGASLSLPYYFSPGCASCDRFLAREIPRLERRYDISLTVERNDIFDAETYERYLGLLEELGEQERAYPAIVVGDRVLQGDREIEAELPGVIAELAESAEAARAPAGRETGAPIEGGAARGRQPVDLAVFPVIAAGLLDGINPCAFTTLIFLVSALAVAGKRRREVLILGLFYTASVFITYYLIGIGFLSAVRYAHSFFLVATIIRWILVAVLVVFAALSFYDFLLIHRGETGKIVLQLPGTMKRRIHDTIKARSRSATLVGSAVVLGFLVSVFELACTGQVYLPTIVYTVRSGRALRGYVYLLIYNLGFIVPLLAVFALSFAGLSLKSLTAVFQKRMGSVKLALAGLFVGLAVLTMVM